MENLKAIEEGRLEDITLPARVLKREIPKAYQKAYQKAYYQRPEIKAYKKAYQKAYYQRPEIKAYQKAYKKAYYQSNRKEILKKLIPIDFKQKGGLNSSQP